MLLLLFSLASAKLLISRSVLTELVAVNELLTVRYELTNNSLEHLSNVALFDKSFMSNDFRFVEGKTQAELTCKSIGPGETLSLTLKMFPRNDRSYKFNEIQLSYTHEDGFFESDVVHDEGTFSVIPQAEFRSKNRWDFHEYVMLGVLVLLSVVLPLGYSAYLRVRRSTKVMEKSS